MMSVSLLGIILVQTFWIQNAIETKKKQFADDVKFVMSKVSDELYKDEVINFTVQFMDFVKNKNYAKEADISKFVYEQVNTTTNETFRYASSAVSENQYYIGLNDFRINDSLLIASISSKNDVFKIKNATSNIELSNIDQSEKFTFYSSLKDVDKVAFEQIYKNKISSKPIYERLNPKIIKEMLQSEFESRNIAADFKFGVFINNYLTNVKSPFYKTDQANTFSTNLFDKLTDDSDITLKVTFPKKNTFILSSLTLMLGLSAFFTIAILIVFTFSVQQILKQKKISEVKTDFINNMTHEFKTPIATINLALDSIKNPSIHSDSSKLLHYIGLMKEENSRMHKQVENVLQISKLEKKQLDITKTTLSFKQAIDNAIKHTKLLLDSHGGKLTINNKIKKDKGYGNLFHLTNVFANIIENAIKYSDKAPTIHLDLFNNHKYFMVKITDQGIGMSKSAQKNVFNKFYREQRGNIHNVKGHGLGLSYVKEIVTIHGGFVYIESEKEKEVHLRFSFQYIN